MFACKRAEFGVVKENGTAALNGQHTGTCCNHRLQGPYTHCGYVESHILLRFGHLDDDETALGAELTSTLDTEVGTLARPEDRVSNDDAKKVA